MPELPEIAAHAERLDEAYAGTDLAAFRALTFTALKTYAPAPDEAVGTALTGVGHRGKHLLLRFPAATFVVHLMQGGRLKPDEKQSPQPKPDESAGHDDKKEKGRILPQPKDGREIDKADAGLP